jgi:hypothetical protein
MIGGRDKVCESKEPRGPLACLLQELPSMPRLHSKGDYSSSNGDSERSDYQPADKEEGAR